MKYIIMCGGDYREWETPRHMTVVRGEEIVARTIRLLRENGVKDIAISSNNPAYSKYGVDVLGHDNDYYSRAYNDSDGYWCDAFFPTDEPTCYIFGDVYFSPEAIRKIVETPTDDIEFFGSAPPFAKNYPKRNVEAFAFKVANTEHLKQAIQKTKEMDAEGKFMRQPIAWELWSVIKGVPAQKEGEEYKCGYNVINDYSCDIDHKGDVKRLERVLDGKA